jgi:hypothetical protein
MIRHLESGGQFEKVMLSTTHTYRENWQHDCRVLAIVQIIQHQV